MLVACGERGELLGSKESLTSPSPPAFDAPQLVASLASSTIDEDPTFRADLLELFFMSMRDGTKDIWTSKRAVVSEAWGAPVRVAELSSPGDDWAPSITPDGLVIYFVTDRDAGHAQLWRASRATRAVAWEAPLAITEFASSAADTGPDVDAAERTLYFSSDRAGGGKVDIYVSTRPAADAPWGAPAAAPGLNTPDADFDPFIDASGRLLFLTRISSSNEGDIYWTARRSATEPWATAVQLATVNSPSYDSDAFLSPDLSYLMFSSMRSGNGDIYEAHALP
jgi:Tol biopolymer transport system component